MKQLFISQLASIGTQLEIHFKDKRFHFRNSVKMKTVFVVIGSKNQFRNHETWIFTKVLNQSDFFDNKTHRHVQLHYGCNSCFYNWLTNCWKIGFIVSELIVGSGEQDIYLRKKISYFCLNPEWLPGWGHSITTNTNWSPITFLTLQQKLLKSLQNEAIFPLITMNALIYASDISNQSY